MKGFTRTLTITFFASTRLWAQPPSVIAGPTGVECGPLDSTVSCCLKQHPGEAERCGASAEVESAPVKRAPPAPPKSTETKEVAPWVDPRQEDSSKQEATKPQEVQDAAPLKRKVQCELRTATPKPPGPKKIRCGYYCPGDPPGEVREVWLDLPECPLYWSFWL